MIAGYLKNRRKQKSLERQQNKPDSIDVKGTRHKKHLACISTALNTYRTLGKELYTEALSVINESWNDKPDSLHFEIVKSVTEFMQNYNGKYDKSVLIAALKGKKPISIRNKIITDYEHLQNIRFACQIMLAYNSKSDKPLTKLKKNDKH